MSDALRLLRAFVWLRWRLTVNSLRRGRDKGGLEAVSAVASLVVPIILAVLLLPLLFGITVASVVAGWGVAAHGGPWLFGAGLGLRILTGIMLVALLVAPLARSAKGGSVEYARYALLPVPRRMLHAIELVSAMADPWLLAVLPAILLLPLGFLAGGGSIGGGALAFLVGAVMAMFLTCLSGLVQFCFHLVFRSRRRGEAIFLVFTMVASSVGMVSSIVERGVHDRTQPRVARGEPERLGGGQPSGPTERKALPGGGQPSGPVRRKPLPGGGAEGQTQSEEPQRLPDLTPRGWTRVLPSELYAASALNAMEGRLPEAAAEGALLAGEAFLLYLASLWAWRRLLETPATGSSRRGTNRFRPLPALGILPGGPAVRAVASAVVRIVPRTVTGKMAVWFAPVFSILFGLTVFQTRDATPGRQAVAGAVLTILVGLLSMLSLQPVLLNQFAADRAGLHLEFLAPLSDRDLVRGKVLGAGILVAFTSCLAIVPAVFIAPGTSPLLYPAALLVVMSAYALAGPEGAVLSALLPVTMDLGKLGRAARPHQGAALLFFLILGLSAAPGVGLAAIGYWLLGGSWAALALSAAWFAVAVALGSAVTALAAALVSKRRENLALVAGGR